MSCPQKPQSRCSCRRGSSQQSSWSWTQLLESERLDRWCECLMVQLETELFESIISNKNTFQTQLSYPYLSLAASSAQRLTLLWQGWQPCRSGSESGAAPRAASSALIPQRLHFPTSRWTDMLGSSWLNTGNDIVFQPSLCWCHWSLLRTAHL